MARVNKSLALLALVLAAVVSNAAAQTPRRAPPPRKVTTVAGGTTSPPPPVIKRNSPPPPPYKAQPPPPPPVRTLDAYTAAVKAAPGYGQVYAYVWSQTTRQTCSSTSWFKTLFFKLNVPAKIDNVNCVLVSQGIAYTADLADVTGTQNGADIVNLVSVDNVIAWAAQTKICAADLHIMMFAVSTKTGSFDVPDARKSWSCTGARNSIKVPQLCKC
eukprot:CAMPEP_0202889778 /NCGR_PEP_ID=MMETSP1392-20130828/353_1 /ASSEMBLY_ACC=CAM_ASM_000868 /TAXON_ID=225041 /ORGANISM="Chlamydomonas chlamydogama, Strain SAG 11-48b" /LENGTH=215 /DNA_ID=CAMNT_0049573185 /DNA_START=86 /DNA_END=733 /DNA_ORIENTATION=-